jgi:ribosomal protein S18 acetylase RimI-like enzyme
MMNGVKVREITVKDVPRVVEIQESITKKKVPKAWAQSMETHLRKQDVAGFVALRDDEVVGFIIGEIKGPGFGIEKSGWIVVVGVCPRYMGIGIGQKLAKKIFEYFKKKGVQDIFTAVCWDAVDMLSFFKSIGFDRSSFISLGKHLR